MATMLTMASMAMMATTTSMAKMATMAMMVASNPPPPPPGKHDIRSQYGNAAAGKHAGTGTRTRHLAVVTRTSQDVDLEPKWLR
eukprot:4521494-Karenia_brevis.AAC.1